MTDVITYWNSGAKELYGWDSDEVVGRTTHEVTKTIFPVPLPEINETLLATGRWEGQLVHTKRDGIQVVVASRWALQRDEHGNPAAILETNNDVTEQRRAEESLRESEAQWKAVFENNPTMYFMVDAAGTIMSVNRWRRPAGYTVGELIAGPCRRLPADDRKASSATSLSVSSAGRAVSWEFRKSERRQCCGCARRDEP